MKCLIKNKLSEHKSKTPEGYLICQDAILARTGKQEYYRSEIFPDEAIEEDEIIEVDRKPEQVFSDATLASFENKPLTFEHPEENVTPENFKDLACGFVRDVRKGIVDGQDVMLGTIIVTDADTISAIENGDMTELSCGYDCDITEGRNPEQINIRGNHVALCLQGRAGIAKIVDSKTVLTASEDAKDRVSKGEKYIVVNNGGEEFGKFKTAREAYNQIKDLEEFDNEENINEEYKISVEKIIEYEYYSKDLKNKQDIINRKKELDSIFGEEDLDESLIHRLKMNGFDIHDSIKDADPKMINFLIEDEKEAIAGYEKAIKQAELEKDEKAIKRYKEIIADEEEHIKELEELLEKDPNEKPYILQDSDSWYHRFEYRGYKISIAEIVKGASFDVFITSKDGYKVFDDKMYGTLEEVISKIKKIIDQREDHPTVQDSKKSYDDVIDSDFVVEQSESIIATFFNEKEAHDALEKSSLKNISYSETEKDGTYYLIFNKEDVDKVIDNKKINDEINNNVSEKIKELKETYGDKILKYIKIFSKEKNINTSRIINDDKMWDNFLKWYAPYKRKHLENSENEYSESFKKNMAKELDRQINDLNDMDNDVSEESYELPFLNHKISMKKDLKDLSNDYKIELINKNNVK